MRKILIVEDDKDIAELVERFFQANQFDTYILHDGSDVINNVKSMSPDLIILDINLPIKDGLTCCKEIRAFSNIPIIMLTAKKEEIDKLTGLDLGADDYVCKPFSAPELVLRAKTILKRTDLLKPQRTLNWQLTELPFSVSFQGRTIELTGAEFRVFQLLFIKPNQIFSRESILNSVSNEHCAINDRAIDSHIKNIRKRLKNNNMPHDVIETVYGAGYRFKP